MSSPSRNGCQMLKARHSDLDLKSNEIDLIVSFNLKSSLYNIT